MITKTIFIEFANPQIRAANYISDIIEAAYNAKFNLYFRYKIHLHQPYIKDNMVFIEMDIPEDIGETIKCGNHLRGISAYLLKKKGDFYKQHRIGNRLLYYIEVDKDLS